MNKKTKRSVMNSIAQLDLTDQQVLSFIKNLAQCQMYKSPQAFEQFCVDCGIFYTSSVYTMLHRKDEGVSEYGCWAENFVDQCKYFNILFNKENKQ